MNVLKYSMTWYHVKFISVSGKPDEYIHSTSEKSIKEFLYNHYSNSSSYVITKEDIQRTKLIKTDKSTKDIKNILGVNLNPYRAVNINTGIIWESHIDNDNNRYIESKSLFLRN